MRGNICKDPMSNIMNDFVILYDYLLCSANKSCLFWVRVIIRWQFDLKLHLCLLVLPGHSIVYLVRCVQVCTVYTSVMLASGWLCHPAAWCMVVAHSSTRYCPVYTHTHTGIWCRLPVEEISSLQSPRFNCSVSFNFLYSLQCSVCLY